MAAALDEADAGEMPPPPPVAKTATSDYTIGEFGLAPPPPPTRAALGADVSTTLEALQTLLSVRGRRASETASLRRAFPPMALEARETRGRRLKMPRAYRTAQAPAESWAREGGADMAWSAPPARVCTRDGRSLDGTPQ